MLSGDGRMGSRVSCFPGAEKGWACSQALGALRWRGGLVS
jgi:hypothetical protein